MKITIEPTRELYNARINDATVPVRMWRGRTEDGIEIEAYLLAIAPAVDADAERLQQQYPTGSIRVGGWPGVERVVHGRPHPDGGQRSCRLCSFPWNNMRRSRGGQAQT
jgi:hypothetical protein